MHDVAPVTNRGSDEADIGRQSKQGDQTFAGRLRQQDLQIRKWALLWKSIILSSLGKTLFPYCRYIRALSLQDLQTLFEDPKFRGNVDKYVQSL